MKSRRRLPLTLRGMKERREEEEAEKEKMEKEKEKLGAGGEAAKESGPSFTRDLERTSGSAA